jgi:hypothetical protein
MGLFDIFKKKKDEPTGPDPVVLALIERLKADDWQRRLDASHELGRMGARAASAQPALEEATCDEHNEVCTAAADALSAIRRALH